MISIQLNQAGIDLIKRFEGCKLEAYQDIVGVWTIGYGDTGPDVVPGLKITQEEADRRLHNRLSQFSERVIRLITTIINCNQFSALVSLAYNVGVENVKNSTLLKLVNEGKFTEASNEFVKWDHAGGKEIEGLKNRRLAEKELFDTPLDHKILTV